MDKKNEKQEPSGLALAGWFWQNPALQSSQASQAAREGLFLWSFLTNLKICTQWRSMQKPFFLRIGPAQPDIVSKKTLPKCGGMMPEVGARMGE